MTWNYRVIKREDEQNGCAYQIHEVYYDDAGKIETWTKEAVKPLGESLEALREDCAHFLQAFRQPVLVEEEVDGTPILRPEDETAELKSQSL